MPDKSFSSGGGYRWLDAWVFAKRKIERTHSDFVEQGGFAENLTKDRLAARDAAHATAGDAPMCPKCGKPMRKQTAKRGRNAGNEFWSCTGWPECNGTRSVS